MTLLRNLLFGIIKFFFKTAFRAILWALVIFAPVIWLAENVNF